MSEDKKPFGKLENLKLPEVNKTINSKPKTVQEVNQFDNSSKLEKEGVSVNKVAETPMKIGKDYIPYDKEIVKNILESGGKNVSPLSPTPDKTVKEVNSFDNSNKLENEGKNVNTLPNTPQKDTPEISNLSQTPQKDTPEISNLSQTPEKDTPEISNLSNIPKKEGVDVNQLVDTPEKSTADISPFNSLGNFEKLQSFSPNDRDKISEVDFLNNDHAKGFVKNFNEGSDTKYTESPSDLTLGSNLDNRTFNSNNKYLDDINTKQNGNFPSRQQELTNNSTNPLLTTHWEDIGLPTPGHNNVTQAVDFLGGSNSYFEAISPEIPGFTQSPMLKYTLYGAENFADGVSLSNMGKLFPPLVTSGITPAILDGDPEGSNFDDGSGNITTTKFDPRPEFFGIPSFTLMGHQNKNQYEGSIFDELLDVQFNPFFNDIDSYENVASNSLMTEFTDIGAMLTENYQYQIFDPREERLGVLPTGQTDIKFPNPKNTYEGTKFDDPLVDGVEGGGRFNTSSPSQKYSNVFRTINTPTLQQIIQDGFGHPEALTAEELYSETGGVFSGTNSGFENGTTPTPYTDNTMIIGESPEGQGTIDLSSTWYFGNNPFPVTNNILNESFEGENETRTINVNLESLAGNRLGFSDLVYDTIYGDEANSDSRLTYRYTNSGDRGEEPYIVVNIPDNFNDSRVTSDLFTFNFTGQSNRKGGAFDTDVSRIESFLESPKGEDFVNNMIKLHSLNPRSARVFNSQALTDSYKKSLPLGLKSSGFPFAGVGGPNGAYTYTLYEKTLGHPLLFGIPQGFAGDLLDTLLLIQNSKFRFTEDGEETSGFFGNVFQVKGFFNPIGLTVKTNVTPQQQSMGDILGENLGYLYSILVTQTGFTGQTPAGGIGELGNPRGLVYKEGAPMWGGLMNLLDDLWKRTGDASDIKPGNAAPAPSLDDYGSYTGAADITEEKMGEKTSNDTFSNLKPVDLKAYRNLIPPNDGAISPLKNFGKAIKYTDSMATGSSIPQSLESHKLRSNSVSPDHIKGQGGDTVVYGQRGDFYTLLPIRHGDGLSDSYSDYSSTEDVTNSAHLGYPLYFKDLRDNAYIFFRGYIEGLTESLTPEWSEQSYMGRAENSYTFKKTDRTISFNLNLFAQSRDELNIIYDKIQKLTSMVYPMYKSDTINFGVGHSRAKPPLCKLRIGDLYGSDDNEVLGFLESVTYTFPENNVWEHSVGSRVPKSIQASITYKVLHANSPNIYTKFYGKDLFHQVHLANDATDLVASGDQFSGNILKSST